MGKTEIASKANINSTKEKGNSSGAERKQEQQNEDLSTLLSTKKKNNRQKQTARGRKTNSSEGKHKHLESKKTKNRINRIKASVFCSEQKEDKQKTALGQKQRVQKSETNSSGTP